MGAIALVVHSISSGMVDTGDALTHYFIARYSWAHPELLLDHWGKPLFTLFSSPFAQFGLTGMVAFNVCCFILTCWCADGMLRSAWPVARWIFPPMLGLMPVYGTMVLAGLTEVLFGLMTIVVLRSLWYDRVRTALVVASFLPFSRPEYIAVWPFVIGWVVRERRWGALPALLAGNLFYAAVGAIVHGDAFWAFTRDPYLHLEDAYGSGPLFHFTDRIQHIYGAPYMWALAGAIAAWGVLFRKGDDGRACIFLPWLALFPAFAIVVIHSVLWWKGLHGSLGLDRVLATGAPMGALFVSWMIGRSIRAMTGRSVLRHAFPVLLLAYLAWAIPSFLRERPLPVTSSRLDGFVEDVGRHVGSVKGEYRRIVHPSPQIILHAGLDPFDTATCSVQNRTRAGDLLVWDAHYGPNEGGMQLDDLLEDPALELVKVFVPGERTKVLGGLPLEFFLFAHREAPRSSTDTLLFAWGHTPFLEQTRLDTVPCDVPLDTVVCLDGTEFPLVFGDLDWAMEGSIYSRAVVSGEVDAPIRLVIEENGPGDRNSRWDEPLEGGAFKVGFNIPPSDPGTRRKLYFWDPDRRGVRLAGLRVEINVRMGRPPSSTTMR